MDRFLWPCLAIKSLKKQKVENDSKKIKEDKITKGIEDTQRLDGWK